jgi:hypothetical protein
MLRVARTVNLDRGDGSLDVPQVLGRQLDRGGAEVTEHVGHKTRSMLLRYNIVTERKTPTLFSARTPMCRRSPRGPKWKRDN